MKKYSFMNDYSEGCHPEVLQALQNTNMEQHLPYGGDAISELASELLQAFLEPTETAIHFVTGGTLANSLIAASSLRPHEAVIAVDSGHIVTFETGAVEATGHKVIPVPGDNGKLTANAIQSVLSAHVHIPHTVRPRMVYVSNTTEIGTVYSRQELKVLSETCQQNDLLLWLDGARLGAAIAADDSLSLQDIARLTDIFWIGGTKVGGLSGEAIVIPNAELAVDFDFTIKQRGAMLSKGRFLGCQFQALFTDNLFFRAAARAHELAQKFSHSIASAGFTLHVPCESNQIFAILPKPLITRLLEQFDFYVWKEVDAQHSIVRLVTSWATVESEIDAFIEILNAASQNV